MFHLFAFIAVSLLGHTCNAAVTTRAPSSGEVCRSQSCLNTATYLKSSMNLTADPCHDFHAFACGGWSDNAKHPIPADKVSVGGFDGLEVTMVESIRTQLAKDHSADDTKTSKSVRYASNLYQRCVHSVAKGSEAEGMDQLRHVMLTVLGGEWLIGQNVTHSPFANWTHLLTRALPFGGANVPVFTMSFDSSVENPGSERKLMISSGRFEVSEPLLRNLTASAALVAVYKKGYTEIGRLFCGHDCAHLEADVDAVIELQSQLVQVKLPVELQRDPEYLFETTTVGKLSNQTKLDWKAQIYQPLIEYLIDAKSHPGLITDSSQILLMDPTYIKKAVAILNQTPPRVLHNLLGLSMVHQYGPLVSGRVREELQKIGHVMAGLAKPQPPEEQCYYATNQVLPWANSRIFIDHSFGAKEKKVATELVDQIFLTFEHELKTNQWLDDKTRERALVKLHAIKRNVAYPDWVMDNAKLDAFHSLTDDLVFQKLTNVKESLLLSVLHFGRYQMQSDLLAFHKAPTSDRWIFTPATINAFYNPLMNSINMLAGILKYPPFFEADNPFAMNFGGIGMVIAHEITHGFDDVGRKYDEKGAIANWWTAEAADRFRNLSDCFVNQYSAAVEPLSGLHVNGVSGLGENIADNGGLVVGYRAFQDLTKRTGPSPRLVGLEQFTPEQLFFISFANNWCGKMRPEIARQLILLDAHAPLMFRTNIPVSNFAEFGKAFQCPANSPMNPAKRCAVW